MMKIAVVASDDFAHMEWLYGELNDQPRVTEIVIEDSFPHKTRLALWCKERGVGFNIIDVDIFGSSLLDNSNCLIMFARRNDNKVKRHLFAAQRKGIDVELTWY